MNHDVDPFLRIFGIIMILVGLHSLYKGEITINEDPGINFGDNPDAITLTGIAGRIFSALIVAAGIAFQFDRGRELIFNFFHTSPWIGRVLHVVGLT